MPPTLLTRLSTLSTRSVTAFAPSGEQCRRLPTAMLPAGSWADGCDRMLDALTRAAIHPDARAALREASGGRGPAAGGRAGAKRGVFVAKYVPLPSRLRWDTP